MDLVWRPARRVLVVAVAGVAGCVLFGAALFGLDLISAIYPFAFAVVVTAYYGSLALRGRTELTDDYVSTTVLRTVAFDWADVDRVQVVDAAWGRTVQLVVDGRRVRLAAPRAGDPAFDQRLATVEEAAGRTADRTRVPWWAPALVVVPLVALVVWTGLAVDRPWLSDWWPGVHTATAAPQPCTVLDDAALAKALTEHHDAGVPTKSFLGDGCRWQRLGDLGWDLVVSYDRFTRTAKTDGAHEAEDALTLFANHEGRVEVPGLGDHAYAWQTGAITSVLVRRANVIVEIEYNGNPATAVELAHTAAAAVQLD